MIQKIIFNGPISHLSLGQVSFNILRELYKRKIQVVFFPRQTDFSAYKVDPSFGQWIERAANSRYTKLDKKIPTLSVWHLNGSELRYSDKQYLLSFFECDAPSESEINIANQQEITFFSSQFSVDSFKTYGCANAQYVPLGHDEDFIPSDRRLIPDDVTHWVLAGTKFEQRKNTELIIKTWIKRYGGNKAHSLTLLVGNPFFKTEDMNALYNQVFGGTKPFNVNILPNLKTNAEMLQVYNSATICLAGLSSSECWNIPSFTTTALGKWSCVVNFGGHKGWATAENSILVEPDGFRPVYDGIFFRKGDIWNQGNIPEVLESTISAAMERAEKATRTPNLAGERLRQTHTYAKTLDTILEKIGD